MLFDCLNAIVYEMAVNHMLFSKFEVHIEKEKLTAQIWGEKLNHAKHQPAVEIKAATYSELKVGQTESGRWFAQCVVDV